MARLSELVVSNTAPPQELLFRQTARSARHRWKEGWSPAAILQEVAALLGERGHLGRVSLLIVWHYAFWTSVGDMKEAALHVDLTTFGPKTSFDSFMRPLIEARLEQWPDLELEEAV
ncbi:MAG: hypothetical protein Q8N23_15905 [Archangium sp.]|nr:hypothetical protein [Archangium sp.]MDP3569499.1 hypothetical protein [Archangium sp.]